MTKEDIGLQKKLLIKMLNNRVIGAKHLRFDTLVSNVPSHQKGDLKKEIENLLKKGFLVWYHKSKKAIQLNNENRTNPPTKVGGI